MDLNRRQIIRGIGAALCAGVVPKFAVELLTDAPIVMTDYRAWGDSHTVHVAKHIDSFAALLKYYANDEIYIEHFRSASYFWTHIKAHRVDAIIQ